MVIHSQLPKKDSPTQIELIHQKIISSIFQQIYIFQIYFQQNIFQIYQGHIGACQYNSQKYWHQIGTQTCQCIEEQTSLFKR